MRYQVTKSFGQDLGLSVAYRQYKADNHCRYIHGYCLSFDLVYEATVLNEQNWVIGFGEFASFKGWLRTMFDHTFLVARDDPELDTFLALGQKDLCRVLVVDNIGAEAFATMAFFTAKQLLPVLDGVASDCRLVSVSCTERPGNTATCC